VVFVTASVVNFLLCVLEPALLMSNDCTADVIKDVIDNDVDSLRRVFHSFKIEPCRVRLVSTSPMIRGTRKTSNTLSTFIKEIVRLKILPT